MGLARHVDIQTAIESFHASSWRRVHADYSDVQVHGVFYRVDQKLRTLKVEVRMPVIGPKGLVQIYDKNGRYLGQGKEHGREEREVLPPQPKFKSQFDLLAKLRKKHESSLQEQIVDLRTHSQESLYCSSTTALLALLARFLGKTGISNFTTAEVDAALAFELFHLVTAALVKEAVRATGKSCAIDVLKTLTQILSKEG